MTSCLRFKCGRPEVVCKKCSENYCKIHKKTTVLKCLSSNKVVGRRPATSIEK